MAMLNITMLLLAAMTLAGCSVVGDIFEAGVWTGVVVFVLVLVGIFYGIAKFRK